MNINLKLKLKCIHLFDFLKEHFKESHFIKNNLKIEISKNLIINL